MHRNTKKCRALAGHLQNPKPKGKFANRYFRWNSLSRLRASSVEPEQVARKRAQASCLKQADYSAEPVPKTAVRVPARPESLRAPS
jgi:hypothetical protein